MSFCILTSESLKRIRPFLEAKFPKSAMMLNILDATISGKYSDSMCKWKILGYNDVPNPESLFLVVHFTTTCESTPGFGDCSILYAPDVVTEDMLNAYEKLQNWSIFNRFRAVPVEFVKHLEKIAKANGGTVKILPCDDVYLPKEQALNLDLKRDHLADTFELANLRPENAIMINLHWKLGVTGREDLIADMLGAFPAAGVFKKRQCSRRLSNDDENLQTPIVRRNEDLVSFVMFHVLGTISALHTLEEYRCIGLGRWTMESVSKELALAGLIPLCEIEPYNDQSMRLVQKIGFRLAQKVCWVLYTPSPVVSPS